MSNYCVAGIDAKSGEWIRIISEDEVIQHAIKEDDMKYQDGTLPMILDVVRLVCKKRHPNYYQPEIGYLIIDIIGKKYGALRCMTS